MSVKALREALGRLAYSAPDTCDEVSARVVAAAWVELAAIEQAADTLVFEASQYRFHNRDLHRALDTMRSIQEEGK